MRSPADDWIMPPNPVGAGRKEMVKKLKKALKAKEDNTEVQSDTTDDTNIFDGVIDLRNATANELDNILPDVTEDELEAFNP